MKTNREVIGYDYAGDVWCLACLPDTVKQLASCREIYRGEACLLDRCELCGTELCGGADWTGPVRREI